MPPDLIREHLFPLHIIPISTVDYVATDNAGNTATSTRTVIIQPMTIAPSDATTTTQ
jgi:hypothetical protein